MSRTAKKKLRILDDGIPLVNDADSIDFTGLGVEGTALGDNVTETIDNDGTVDTDSSLQGDGSIGDPIGINHAHSNTFTANQGIDYESTNSSEITAFQSLFAKNVALVDTEYGFASMYAGVEDNSDLSGEIEDKVVQKSGFEVGLFRQGDSTVNWIDGYETFRGYTSYVAYGGTISGAKHDAEIVGHDITIQHNVAFSNDGTHLHTIFGNRINIAAFGTISIDSFVTRKAYGEHIRVALSNNADLDEAYGIYIEDVAGGDVNYAIYSATSAPALFSGDMKLNTAGNGFYIKEGSNATMGNSTLVGGTVTVNTTKVTANSRIFLQIDGGTMTNAGFLRVSARSVGTSFTITSSNASDTSKVDWLIIEPA